MSEFKNATITKKANIYFEGKVTSRTVICENGTKKTLGIMLPGEYEFGTTEHEIIHVLGGSMAVKLPGADAWQTFAEGDTFEVAAKQTFQLKISEAADYCCSYG